MPAATAPVTASVKSSLIGPNDKFWVCRDGHTWEQVPGPTNVDMHGHLDPVSAVAAREGVQDSGAKAQETKPRNRPRQDKVVSVEVTPYRVFMRSQMGRVATALITRLEGGDEHLPAYTIEDMDLEGWPHPARHEARAILGSEDTARKIRRELGLEMWRNRFTKEHGVSPALWLRQNPGQPWPDGFGPPA